MPSAIPGGDAQPKDKPSFIYSRGGRTTYKSTFIQIFQGGGSTAYNQPSFRYSKEAEEKPIINSFSYSKEAEEKHLINLHSAIPGAGGGDAYINLHLATPGRKGTHIL